MENLYIKQLTVVSDTDKSANQFRFSNRFNLITADDNSLGKSTLIKLMLWAFGCSPKFDHVWSALNCKVLLEFNIGDKSHKVARFGNCMYLSLDGGEYRSYSKITGEYSSSIQAVFGFEMLLPNKEDPNKLEVPPPAFYFLPFYLDQQKGWIRLWDSFENLHQYRSWQKSVIKFHTGYLSLQHFLYDQQIADKRIAKQPIVEEINRIDTAVETIAHYSPKGYVEFAVSEEEFFQLTAEVEVELAALQSEQQAYLSTMAELQVDRQYLDDQLRIVMLAAEELELDYKFSVERVDGDLLPCPLCGTLHDNSLANRTSILTDKDEALKQGAILTQSLEKVQRKIENIRFESSRIVCRINEINKKYSSEYNYDSPDFSFLNLVAAKTVGKLVLDVRAQRAIELSSLHSQEQQLKKSQRSLVDKEFKTYLDDCFSGLLGRYVVRLNATGVNLSNVKSPLDYNKILGGGAAEAARGVLAYQMAIVNHIYKFGPGVKAPFIVDTPNQQEQTHINYDRIIGMLMHETPGDTQVILGAMSSELLAGYRKVANIIELGRGKVLDREKYYELLPVFSFMEES